jgi:hypothetical protein
VASLVDQSNFKRRTDLFDGDVDGLPSVSLLGDCVPAIADPTDSHRLW